MIEALLSLANKLADILKVILKRNSEKTKDRQKIEFLIGQYNKMIKRALTRGNVEEL